MTDPEILEIPDVIPGADTLLRMRGDAFAPEVKAGDWLVVRKQDTEQEGLLCVVEVDGAIGVRHAAGGETVRGVVVGVIRSYV